jgi:hypothetical protein
MNQMPSLPGSGSSLPLIVAPVQAVMPGCVRMVEPTDENE